MNPLVLPAALLLLAVNFAFVFLYRRHAVREDQLRGARILGIIFGVGSIIIFITATKGIFLQEVAGFWGVATAILGGYMGSRVARGLYIIP
jgi:hypothetical protein